MSGTALTRFRYNQIVSGPTQIGPAGPQGATGATGPAGSGTTDGMGSLTLANGLNSNIVAAGTVVAQRIVGPSAAFSIGGFALSPGSTAGQRLTLVNTTAQPMTIVHEDASSTAANRIDTQIGLAVTLAPRKGSAVFLYDVVSSRWVLQNTGFTSNTRINIRDLGLVGDGSTDLGAAIVAADLVAAAAGLTLYIPKAAGTYVLSGSRSLTANLELQPGAILACAGTLTLNGVCNFPKQQVFSNTAVVVFGAGAIKEIWTEWWGCSPLASASFNTTAFQSALSAYQKLLLTGTAVSTVAPELRTGPGNFPVTTPTASSRAPILTINHANGGVWRGSGTGQTNIAATGFGSLQAPAAVLRRINCVRFEVRDMDFIADTNASRGIASDVKAGDTTITVSSDAGLTFPLRITLLKVNPIGVHYETLNAVSSAANIVTLDRPVRFDYSGGNADGTLNYMFHGCVTQIEDWADVTDALYVTPPAGFSPQLPSNNRLTNMTLGAGSFTGSDYGYSVNCNGGSGSASDGNNDNHVCTNVLFSQNNVAHVHVGHLNAINETFLNCPIGQGQTFYAIHAPDGGTGTLQGCSLSGAWALFALGGLNSHGWNIVGGLSESQCPTLDTSAYVNARTWLTAPFTQPAAGATVTAAFNSTAWLTQPIVAVGRGGWYTATVVDGAHLLLKNTGFSENMTAGLTVPAGQPAGHALQHAIVSMSGFDGGNVPQSNTITASAASGTNTLTLANVPLFLQGLRSGMPVTLCNADGTLLEKNWVADAAAGGGPALNWSTKVLTLRNNLTNNHTVNAGGVYGYLTQTFQADLVGFDNNCVIAMQSQSGGASNIPGLEVRVADVNLLPSPTAASVLSFIGVPFMGSVGWTVDNAALNLIACGFTATIAGARETYVNGGRVGVGMAMFQPTAQSQGARPIGTITGVDTLTPGPNGITSFTGGVSPPRRMATVTPDTVNVTDFIVNYNIASAAVSNLPPPAALPGLFRIRNLDGSHTVTLTPTGGALINGAATYALVAGATVDVDFDGSNYHTA